MAEHDSVTVVTVTYGKRWSYLQQVLARLADLPVVRHIIVVDNASQDAVASRVAAESFKDKVSVVDMGENAGSAKGYKQGLQAALSDSGAQFIYMLDDDNLPAPDALDLLLEAFDAHHANRRNAFLSVRPDRPELVKAARTGQPIRHILNSFSGFHIGCFARDKLKRLRGQSGPDRMGDSGPAASIQIDFAPYGGLLMHRELVERIGLPDETYYLYADDHDYTSRIAQHGGAIFLVSGSLVQDIETSWHLATNSKTHALYSRSNSEFRVFYSVRNRVALEQRFLVKNRFVYFANLLIYLGFRCLHALIAERDPKAVIRRTRLIHRAISDGLSERLGRSFETVGAVR